MFIRRSNIWLLAIILLLLSCKGKQYTEDTRLFNNYLQTCVHSGIPIDTVYWIVVSEYGCEGCIGKTVTKMKDNEKAMFIVNENTYYRYIKPKNVLPEKYLIDSTDKIKRLQYHQHNVGIVQTANHEIYNIIYVAYNGADSTLSKIE